MLNLNPPRFANMGRSVVDAAALAAIESRHDRLFGTHGTDVALFINTTYVGTKGICRSADDFSGFTNEMCTNVRRSCDAAEIQTY